MFLFYLLSERWDIDLKKNVQVEHMEKKLNESKTITNNKQEPDVACKMHYRKSLKYDIYRIFALSFKYLFLTI